MRYIILFLCLLLITPLTYSETNRRPTAGEMKKKYGIETERDKKLKQERALHDSLGHNSTRKKSKRHGFFTKLKHGLWTCNASCTRHPVYQVLKKCVLTEQDHPNCLHNLEADIENNNTKSKFGATYSEEIPKHKEQIAALIQSRYSHLNQGKQKGEWEHDSTMMEQEKRVQALVNANT